MLGSTSSSLDIDANDCRERPLAPLASTNYLCTSCLISFPDGQEQRKHMKEPWHVYNIKRRVASLPPISRNVFDKQLWTEDRTSEPATSTSKTTSLRVKQTPDDHDKETSDDDCEQQSLAFKCLFCSHEFTHDDTGLTLNVDHMRSVHAMCIPDPESVIDMQSFLGYLATEVRLWHECLYCGATKASTLSIQSHMRDTGHCCLNLEREPELVEFWTSSRYENEIATATLQRDCQIDSSTTEARLHGGRVISSRLASIGPKKISRRQNPAVPATKALSTGLEAAESLPHASESQLWSNRQLACREEMAISGVSVQMRRELALAEKKAQRTEAIARRAREWAYARGANSQKFDQLDNQMKWGKQNHKLLPR